MRAAIQALDAEDWQHVAGAVTVAEAEQVLAEIEGRGALCPPDAAVVYAETIVGFYPARQVFDPRIYISGLTAIFAAYPLDFVKRVCNPVTGLPGKQKFLPAPAEVKEALDAEAARRIRIQANARYVLQQAAKREAEAKEAHFWQQQRLPPEIRAQQVAALLKGVVRDAEA